MEEQNIQTETQEKPELRPKIDVPSANNTTAAPDTIGGAMGQLDKQQDPIQQQETSPMEPNGEDVHVEMFDYSNNSPAQPVPAQAQLPSDSYLYANTSSLGGVINSTAEQYSIDPHQLEALTNTIRNKQAKLSGFYDMQIGYYPGMSAESLVSALGRVTDLANTVSEREKHEAELKGQKYTSNGIDKLVESLQSTGGKQSGKAYYQDVLNKLQESDHAQWDNQTLAQYYETMIKMGHSKADAWLQTMNQQDKYRESQDKRAVMSDINGIVDPNKMQEYAANLLSQVQNTKDADTKIRSYAKYEAAQRLADAYASAFAKDPVGYLQVKDPGIKSLLQDAQKSGDSSKVISALDVRYTQMGVPEYQRKYLSDAEANSAAAQINTYFNGEPGKAQQAIVALNKKYGKSFDKVYQQLMRDKKVSADTATLIEAMKTGSPATNEDVLDMLKNKANFKGDFLKTMLGTPDSSSAKTKFQALESKMYGMPGYKAVVNNLDLNKDIAGKTKLAQYYANMAAYYVYKDGLSDKKAVEKVQRELIDNVYAYDAAGRVALQRKTLDGREIKYNKYTVEQAINYLTNRGFNKQNYRVGLQSAMNSENLLRDKNKIRYNVIDQYTVQPIYRDDNGVNQVLYKTDSKGNYKLNAQGQKIPVTFNLRTLGDEDILGIVDAKKTMRDVTKTILKATNLTVARRGSEYGMPLSKDNQEALHILRTIGVDVKNFKDDKPMYEQFDRTKLSPKRIQALKDMQVYQQQFDMQAEQYAKLKKQYRSEVAPFSNGLKLVAPFLHEMAFPAKNPQDSQLYKTYKKSMADSDQRKGDLHAARVKMMQIEDNYMRSMKTFLNYQGKLPVRPFTKDITDWSLDDALWGYKNPTLDEIMKEYNK